MNPYQNKNIITPFINKTLLAVKNDIFVIECIILCRSIKKNISVKITLTSDK